MAVPEEYGGGGNAGLPLQRRSSPRRPPRGRYSGLGFALQNDVIAPYLLRLATEEQKQRWLPGFC